MSQPSPSQVRERINQVTDTTIRMTLTACDLWCARISEVVAEPKPGEHAYGPKANDMTFEDYEGNEITVFNIHTAKRQGLIRKVAMPLRQCKELTTYIQGFDKNESVFPFNRDYPKDYITRVQPVFEGLSYPIEKYLVTRDGKLERVPSHQRAFRLHALRHLRATELVEKYGFDGFNLAAYGGWTIRTASSFFGQSIPSVISRYLYLNWQGYIGKLLRK